MLLHLSVRSQEGVHPSPVPGPAQGGTPSPVTGPVHSPVPGSAWGTPSQACS